MKLTQLAKPLLLALALTVAALGCRKTPVNVTDLPGYKPGIVGDPFANAGADTNLLAGAGTNSPTPMTDPNVRKDWPRDHEFFKSDTWSDSIQSSSLWRRR